MTDPEDIKRITREFTDAKGDVPYTNNPGQKKYADGGTISMALIKAAEAVTFGKKSSVASSTGMAAPGPAPVPPIAGGNSSHIVTIDIGGGRRDTFNMASEADASGLAGFLSQLRNAKAAFWFWRKPSEVSVETLASRYRVTPGATMNEKPDDLLKRAIAAYLGREATPPILPPVYLAPDRYVTVGIYAAITGRTENSIRMKMRDGKWLEGREFIKDPDGTVLIDREGVQKWVLRGN